MYLLRKMTAPISAKTHTIRQLIETFIHIGVGWGGTRYGLEAVSRFLSILQ